MKAGSKLIAGVRDPLPAASLHDSMLRAQGLEVGSGCAASTQIIGILNLRTLHHRNVQRFRGGRGEDSAHIRQSRPDYGLGLSCTKVLKTSKRRDSEHRFHARVQEGVQVYGKRVRTRYPLMKTTALRGN